MMKTILHIVDYYPGFHERTGGAEQAAARIIEFCSSHFRNIIVTQTSAGVLPRHFRTVNSIRSKLPRRLRPLVESIVFAGLFNDPRTYDSIERIISEESPDIVHFHNFKLMGSKILKIPGKYGCKVIVSIYDYGYFCPLTFLFKTSGENCKERQGIACRACRLKPGIPFTWLTVLLSLLRKRICTRYLTYADIFHVLSENSARILIRQGIPSKKVRVIRQMYNLAPESSVPVRTSDNGKTILYAGWLAPHKGLLTVLKAFRLFLDAEASKGFTLIVLAIPAGMARYGNQVNTYLEDNTLRSRVRFLGRMDKNAFVRYMIEATIVVVAELWENMSPVLLTEAMAYGKAIVAGAMGGIPEFITHEKNGMLAKCDDPASYAAMFTRCAADNNLARSLGVRARSSYERLFTSASLAAGYLQMYEETGGKWECASPAPYLSRL
jgi:glycosyltransferase involved in cell wall biosynthesis